MLPLCSVGRTQLPLSHKQNSSELPTSLWLRQPQWTRQPSMACRRSAIKKLWQNWHPAIVKLLPNCRQATGCFLDVLASHDLTQIAFDVLMNLIQNQRIVSSIGGFKNFISFIFTGDKMPMRAFTSNPTNGMLGGEEEANFATNLKPRDLRSCPQDPPADWRWVSESVWSFSSRNKRTVNVADQMKKPRKCW